MYSIYNFDFYSNDIDNGKYDNLANDIEEKILCGFDTLNISNAIQYEQEVTKQVRTDLTNGEFIEGTAEMIAGSEYTYKLNITAEQII